MKMTTRFYVASERMRESERTLDFLRLADKHTCTCYLIHKKRQEFVEALKESAKELKKSLNNIII